MIHVTKLSPTLIYTLFTFTSFYTHSHIHTYTNVFMLTTLISVENSANPRNFSAIFCSRLIEENADLTLLKSLNWKNSLIMMILKFKYTKLKCACLWRRKDKKKYAKKIIKNNFSSSLQVHSLYRHTSVHTYVSFYKFHYTELIFN